MFDNACKYNEPDSQIYKDALTLQSLAHRTCRGLFDDENSVPDVQAAVQDILSFIFISVYNHQDAEERCFTDSLAELPEHDEVDGRKTRALNLDLVKQRLDRGLYKRLDTFQKDVFNVFERARNLSRSDSQIFEDATELQSHFIKVFNENLKMCFFIIHFQIFCVQVRDEACGNGSILQSKALLFTITCLHKAVEELRLKKKGSDVDEEIKEESKPKQEDCGDTATNSVTFNQEQYNVGEFVYAAMGDKPDQKGIFLIESIYTNKQNGEQTMYGNQFYRPVETFHVRTRKFLECEVFRTDVHLSVPLSKIVGRCVVVPVRDYFRSKPDGFADEDVYVCESKYASKSRSFKKMKIFWATPEGVRMVPRPCALEPKRVMSVFKERIERHKEELEEIEAMIKGVDEALPHNVLWVGTDVPQVEGRTYYEQYTIPGPITLRRGDHVYVRSENGKNLIAQIDTMWTAEE